jgi:hypothetical protein
VRTARCKLNDLPGKVLHQLTLEKALMASRELAVDILFAPCAGMFPIVWLSYCLPDYCLYGRPDPLRSKTSFTVYLSLCLKLGILLADHCGL